MSSLSTAPSTVSGDNFPARLPAVENTGQSAATMPQKMPDQKFTKALQAPKYKASGNAYRSYQQHHPQQPWTTSSPPRHSTTNYQALVYKGKTPLLRSCPLPCKRRQIRLPGKHHQLFHSYSHSLGGKLYFHRVGMPAAC
ncbi:hypothetical protein [Pseudomonas sp. BMW13]|uniref:hypothetical protein n=2 Tax=Pseudomonadaceae TaxID=135621 RepID=UPI001582028E|nr:hypothetical protein [Pseudomonas sp. BMW13]